jgi:recombination endonuclease VII
MTPEEKKARQRAWSAKWRQNNPEKDRANDLRYQSENKDKIKKRSRELHLQRKFGISAEDYNQMLAQQNNVCAICKRPCATGKALAVDHNHETGKVRALLCKDCNVSIGLMKEDPDLLRTAANYLELHKIKETSNAN